VPATSASRPTWVDLWEEHKTAQKKTRVSQCRIRLEHGGEADEEKRGVERIVPDTLSSASAGYDQWLDLLELDANRHDVNAHVDLGNVLARCICEPNSALH
jgi:hypothetical protein